MFITNFVKKVFNTYFSKSQSNVNYVEVGLIEVYLEEIFKILCWRDFGESLAEYGLLCSVSILIYICHLRFYGSLFLIALLIFLYDTKYRKILYANYKGEYAELIKGIKNGAFDLINTLQSLRRDSPLMFASVMVFVFLLFRIIFLRLSGYLLYMMVPSLSLILSKGIQLLPETTKERLRQFITAFNTPECILAEDELIPFIQGKDFSKRDVDLDSLLTDHTADSVTNSLVSGIVAMPSYLEVAETTKDIEEEDLMPRCTPQGTGELSSDSDSDNRDIQFDSDHFNTSSSEEDPLAVNLNFPKDVREATSENEGLRTMISNVMSSVGGNLVANILHSAINKDTPVRKVNSESDHSDFEIIDYASDDDIDKK